MDKVYTYKPTFLVAVKDYHCHIFLLPPSLPLAPSRVASAPGVGLRSFSLCSFSTFAAKLGFCSDLDGFLVKGFLGAFFGSEGEASISLDFLS